MKNFDGGILNYGGTSGVPIVIKTPPAGIAPCYEYVAPTGYTVYFIYASNGVEVQCPSGLVAGLSPAWQNSGVSGSAFATFGTIVQAMGVGDSM
jgi:hypothetical protein